MKNLLRNKSWNVLLSFALLTILVPHDLYAEPKNGVQFDSGGNFGYIHYGDNFGYAAGASVGFGHDNDDVAQTQEVELGVFARKNFKLEEKIYLGLGITGGINFGERDGKDIHSSFSVGPYFILDYHLNKHFILNAGATIVELEYEEIGVAEAVTSYDYFSPFLSLTYLF